jgi:DNA replication protein DnaC
MSEYAENFRIETSGLLVRYRNACMEDLVGQTSPDLINFLYEFKNKNWDEVKELDINVMLWGARRIGKTYCLHIIANHLIDLYGNESVYYTNAHEIIMYRMKEMLIPNTNKYAISYLSKVNYLFIDDFGHEYKTKNNNYVQSELERFLRYRYNNKKVTFLAMDFKPHDELPSRYSESLADFILSDYTEYNIGTGENISALKLEEKIAKEKANKRKNKPRGKGDNK